MVYTASATILVNRFVKISGDNTVATQTTSGGNTIGISQDGGRYAPVPSNTANPVEAAQSGETLLVHLEGEPGSYPMLLLGTGGATAGQELMSHTDGKGIPATAAKYVGAKALVAGSAGDTIPVQIVGYVKEA